MTPDPSAPLRDADPLDSRLALSPGLTGTSAGAGAAGGLTPALADPYARTLILLPLGFVLGPSGMTLLSQPALSFLDPLVSVALALLGILLGMAPGVRRPGVTWLAGIAALEGIGTALLVAAGVAALYAVWGPPGTPPWTLSLLLGVCACASFAPATAPGERHGGRSLVTGDLDSTLAIGAGALVLTVARHGAAAPAGVMLGGLSLIALSIAGAGWLLVGGSSSDRERHTFVAGTLLLLGGSAAYLGSSALLMGLLAGALWGRAGGPAGERLARDVQYVQHPLVVLLLVTAGARLEFTSDALVLALVYGACRTVGKLAAELLLARRVSAQEAADSDPQTPLTAPGIVGAAIAVDVLQSGGMAADGSVMLSAVVLASLVIDVVHMTARRFEVRR